MSADVERAVLAPGLEISRVLTGLWQIADLERDGTPVDPAATADAMRPYVDAGFTTFDMADHYGSAEVVAGAYRRRHDAEAPAEVLTKWVPAPGPVTRADVRAAVERALERLGTDRIPLMQFHAWAYWDPRWLDCLYWLSELRGEGLIGHLGLTNFDTAHLRMVLHGGIEVVSNQVCHSLVDRRAGGAMADLCLEHGVSLLAYGTVAGGLLTERWLGEPDPPADGLPTWSLRKYKRFVDAAGEWADFQELLRAVKAVADRRGASMANVACRWVLDRPAVAGIIVGARLGVSEHVDDNRRLFDLALTDADTAELDAAADAFGNVPGDCGDEYRKPPFLTAAGDLSDHFDAFPAPFEVRRLGDAGDRALTGTVWEGLAGFARAARRGDRIAVSGTTATHRDRPVGGTDAASQTHFVIDKIEGALRALGAGLDDVVRTRVYVRPGADWEAVSRAHGERFGEVMPANTLIEAGIIGDEYLVEMEVDAVSGSERTRTATET